MTGVQDVVGQAAANSAPSRWAGTLRPVLIAALLVASTAWIYGRQLEYAPPNLEIDEVLIGLDAHAIATSGRDLGGERLPLYSRTAEHSWYQPWVIYVTAVALKLGSLSERVVRVPTVCFGVLNVLLMYLVARRLFSSEALGAIAAVMLMLTPAHFLHSRYAMDYMYPVTFVLAWLLCLVAYGERPRTWVAIAAAAVLGLGFYSYISAIVLMPLYLAMTCLFLASVRAPRRAYVATAVVFAAFLLPFVVWFAGHPAAFGATVEKYGGTDARSLTLLQSVRHLVGLQSVSDRAAVYWNMLSPSVLFLTGGSRVMFSTGRAGVFLVPLAVLLPVGLYQAAARRRTPIAVLLVIGFLTAPLPALMVSGDNAPIFRALTIVPFGILLAAIGLRALWNSPIADPVFARLRLASPLGPLQLAAAVLVALVPLQFAVYASDYFHAYRVRSSPWLGGNIGGALEMLIADSGRAPAIYFSRLQSTAGIADGRNEYMNAYWQFYLTKHGREELAARTRAFDPAGVASVAPGSLVLANVGDRVTENLVATGALKQIATVPELDRPPFFAILER